MNKFLSLGVLTLALALTGCGGDSDSSGSAPPVNNNNPGTTKPSNPKPSNPKPETPKCKQDGKTFLVPQGGSCDASIPKVNKGVASTYYCSGQRVSLGHPQSGSISAGTLNFGGYTVKCE